jgi:hypothetical protein
MYERWEGAEGRRKEVGERKREEVRRGRKGFRSEMSRGKAVGAVDRCGRVEGGAEWYREVRETQGVSGGEFGSSVE